MFVGEKAIDCRFKLMSNELPTKHHLFNPVLNAAESYISAKLAFEVANEGCQSFKFAAAGYFRAVII